MVQLCNLGSDCVKTVKSGERAMRNLVWDLPPCTFCPLALELHWSLGPCLGLCLCHSHTGPGLNALLLLTLPCWIPVLILDLLWHCELIWWSLAYQLNLVIAALVLRDCATHQQGHTHTYTHTQRPAPPHPPPALWSPLASGFHALQSSLLVLLLGGLTAGR